MFNTQNCICLYMRSWFLHSSGARCGFEASWQSSAPVKERQPHRSPRNEQSSTSRDGSVRSEIGKDWNREQCNGPGGSSISFGNSGQSGNKGQVGRENCLPP